jgi:general secretion pathway protein G
MNRTAFSLIELLLVLVILAVLAAIVVPRFTGRSQQARNTAARTDIASIELALDIFETDNGRYPANDEGLEALIRLPSGLTEDTWQGPYLKRESIPADPWGNDYTYRYPGQRNTRGYDLYSAGPDGQAGNDDDITNWSENQ